MRALRFACVCVGLSLGACRSSPSEPDPGAKAPAGRCAGGGLKIPSLGFCIELPDGYEPGRPSEDEPGKLRIPIARKGTTESFVVRATDDALDDVSDAYLDPAKNRIKGKGELLSGKGKWFYSTPRSGKGATIGVYVQGPAKLYTCEMAAGEDGPELGRTLSICKTITPLPEGPSMGSRPSR